MTEFIAIVVLRGQWEHGKKSNIDVSFSPFLCLFKWIKFRIFRSTLHLSFKNVGRQPKINKKFCMVFSQGRPSTHPPPPTLHDQLSKVSPHTFLNGIYFNLRKDTKKSSKGVFWGGRLGGGGANPLWIYEIGRARRGRNDSKKGPTALKLIS